MEVPVRSNSTRARVKCLYVVAGLGLVAVLTIVCSGRQRSSWSPIVTIGSIVEDESLQQSHPYNGRSNKTRSWREALSGIEFPQYDPPTLLNGTFRDDPDNVSLRSKILYYRTKENYTYCSQTAHFVGPYPYLDNAKNPCWYDDDSLRCLPYFYLVGFSKSGTSDLFHRILLHPHVLSSSKEKHWLDYTRYFKTRDSIRYYSSFYKKAAKVVQRDIDYSNYSSKITGDGTPCYAWFNFYWRCYEGNEGLDVPKYTNADVIYRMNPKAKIIMLLRDPVTRLYSRYLTRIGKIDQNAYKHPSPAAFHSLVVNGIKMFDKCVQRWSVRHCAFNGTLYTQMSLRLVEGLYSVFLKDWLKLFPREQILIMRFEDYVKDVSGFLKKTFDFLNIDQLPATKLERIVKATKSNPGRHYYLGPMFNATREILQNFYIPFNNDLPSLLNDNRMHWSYT